MCGQVIWICFGSRSLPGGAAYRSTAMVAVIKAKAFCYLQVLVSRLLWLLVRSVPCFRGRRTVLLCLRSPDTCRQFPCRAKKNGHLPRGGVHKSAISRGHSESWFCRPVGPAAQGLGVPGARPRQEGLPWSYETMGRCRVPVRQTNGFWGRSNGTHLVFICSWDRLLGHRRIGSLVHQVSTSGHSGSSIRVGDSESEAVGVVGKAGKAGKAGRAGRAGRAGWAGKGGKGKRRQQGLGDIEGSLVARRLIDSLGPGASDHS